MISGSRVKKETLEPSSIPFCSIYTIPNSHSRHENVRCTKHTVDMKSFETLLCIPRETKGTSTARFLRCSKHTSTFYERDVISCSRRRSPCILSLGEDFKARLSVLRALGCDMRDSRGFKLIRITLSTLGMQLSLHA
ncbi:hypothetical protein ACS0PU_008488 [Formica fusca]